MKHIVLMLISILILIMTTSVVSQDKLNQPESESVNIPISEKLVVVWTSGDREVALKMVFMYVLNAPRFDWWHDITLIVWGPSAKLLSEDQELQEYMKKIIGSGTNVKACKACSDQYGVSDKLVEIGVNVKYMGGELSDLIKEGRHILTF